jgi:hypothetical protein
MLEDWETWGTTVRSTWHFSTFKHLQAMWDPAALQPTHRHLYNRLEMFFRTKTSRPTQQQHPIPAKCKLSLSTCSGVQSGWFQLQGVEYGINM